jgi:hypothetical protein
MMMDYVAVLRKRGRSLTTLVAIGIASASTAAHKAAAVEMSPAAKAVVDYDKSGDKPG